MKKINKKTYLNQYNSSYTLEDCVKEASFRDGYIVSTEFKTVNDKLWWKCKEGHIFPKTLLQVRDENRWCLECGQKFVGEEICRLFMESIFNNKFPKYRSDWLRNSNNIKLELDGYCKELGISFEHHGIQHYKATDKFGGKEAFERLIKNDNDKIDVCKKFGVKVIIIPQIFLLTKFKNLKNVFEEQLKINNVLIPECFYNINPQKIIITKNDYLNSQLKVAQKLAENNSGKCLSEFFIHINEKLLFECNKGHKGHKFTLSLNILKNGDNNGPRWCKFCKKEELELEKYKHASYDILYKYYCIDNLPMYKISKLLNISDITIKKLLLKYNLEIKRIKNGR